MSDPTYPLYPIFSFLGFVASLVPLPWHLQAWNSGTCAFMLWTAAACLVQFVNAVVWKNHMLNVAPVWCDISTQIMLGAGIGTPASILCISRRLYKITSIQNVSVTRKDKRNDIIIDLCIALGIPILVLVLHTVVHAHRFDILEEIGCYPVTYLTLPTFFLYYLWPIALGLVSFIYSGLTLRSFLVRRAQFTSLLNSANSININRYIRLMLLCIADMAFTVPLAIYVMYIGTHGIPLAPYISWEETHFHWNRVEVVPALIWRGIQGYEITVELSRWLAVFSAIIFFALFGFATEAKKNYAKAFWAIAKRVGYTQQQTKPIFNIPSWNKKPSTSTESQATLPVYAVSHSPPKQKGSSLTDAMELSLYSPDKSNFSPTSLPPMYTPNAHACPSSASCDVEIASSRFSLHGDRSELDIDISEVVGFEDDFKPLPPLPHEGKRFTEAFSPYAPPVPLWHAPLRHATSMPLPQRDRQGSAVSIVVQQTTRVDAR